MASDAVNKVEVFLHHVRKYPCLYDTSIPEYKDLNVKENATREVAEKTQRCNLLFLFYFLLKFIICLIFVAFSEVTATLAKIKARYSKERKQIQEKKSGDPSDEPVSPWPHYQTVHSLFGKFMKSRKYVMHCVSFDFMLLQYSIRFFFLLLVASQT